MFSAAFSRREEGPCPAQRGCQYKVIWEAREPASCGAALCQAYKVVGLGVGTPFLCRSTPVQSGGQPDSGTHLPAVAAAAGALATGSAARGSHPPGGSGRRRPRRSAATPGARPARRGRPPPAPLMRWTGAAPRCARWAAGCRAPRALRAAHMHPSHCMHDCDSSLSTRNVIGHGKAPSAVTPPRDAVLSASEKCWTGMSPAATCYGGAAKVWEVSTPRAWAERSPEGWVPAPERSESASSCWSAPSPCASSPFSSPAGLAAALCSKRLHAATSKCERLDTSRYALLIQGRHSERQLHGEIQS